MRRLRDDGPVEVLQAREQSPLGFERDVTLHCLRHDPEATALRANELAREARVCSRLTHPAIVRPLSLEVHGDRMVLAFEGIEALTLDDVLSYYEMRGEQVPEPMTGYVLASIASALAHAHAVKAEDGTPTPVLHRAVTTAAVIVARGGAVKLSGFGIARVLDSSPDSAIGLVPGAHRVAPPEEGAGASPSELSDVWAVGVLALRLFARRDGSSVLAAIAGRPPRLSSLRPDLPLELTAAIDAALNADPAKRGIRCRELARWIERTVDVGRGQSMLRDVVDEMGIAELEDDAPRSEHASRRRVRAMHRRAPATRLAVLRNRGEPLPPRALPIEPPPRVAPIEDDLPLGVPRRRSDVFGWMWRRTVMLAVALATIVIGSVTQLRASPVRAPTPVTVFTVAEMSSPPPKPAVKVEEPVASIGTAALPEAPPIPQPTEKPPVDFGWLHMVAAPDVDGRVWVAGHSRGAVNKTILAPCGRFWLNAAKVGAKGNWRGWIGKGQYASIPCDGTLAVVELAR